LIGIIAAFGVFLVAAVIGVIGTAKVKADVLE